jgi:hypothetical protein
MTDISLHSGEGLRIENGRGLLLAVRSGAIWLTQEADPRDFFLTAGRFMRLDNDGLSVAYASLPATLTVAATPGPDNARPSSFIHRLGRSLFAILERFARARREAAAARLLAELDPRILRDIGLDASSGHPLAGRAEAHRRQSELRAFGAHLGF